MTFAIAVKTATGWAAGASTYPVNVGPNVLSAIPGVGVALAMVYAPVAAGEECLTAMASGMSEADALQTFGVSKPQWPIWQLSLVGRTNTVSAIGYRHLRYASAVVEPDMVCAANLMTNEGVPEAMASAWGQSSGADARERIQQALEAGRDAGGDLRGMRSAGLMIVSDEPGGEVMVGDVNYSLSDPIAALRNAELVHRSQRTPKEERFQAAFDAWSALDGGDETEITKALSGISKEVREAYAGAVKYVELVWAVRTGSGVDKKFQELESAHPEWIEFARRGGDFADELAGLIN